MHFPRFVGPAFAIALFASVGTGGAAAFSSSLAVSKDKTTVLVRPSTTKMTPYGALLHKQILTEVKRTHLPFAITSPFVFVVRFDINRRGQLVDVKILQGSNSREADQYAVDIVKRAARNFPPPPESLPGERLAFAIPIAMQI